MLNRIKRNLPIVAINGALSLFVVFVCAAIGTQDLKMAALLSLGLSLIFAPTLLVLLVVDAVCYHFDVWGKVSAAYDHVMIHYLAAHIIYPLYETIEDGEVLNDLDGETIDGLMEDAGDLQTRIHELEHELHFEGERKRAILSQLDFLRMGDDPPPSTPGVTWVKVPE